MKNIDQLLREIIQFYQISKMELSPLANNGQLNAYDKMNIKQFIYLLGGHTKDILHHI